MAADMVSTVTDTYRPLGGEIERNTAIPGLSGRGEQVSRENQGITVDISRVAKALNEKDPEKIKGIDLTEEEKRQVEKLKERDREVRAHEQAHVAAGGGIVRGGASFQYRTGPDGKMYAIGGEVTIDTSAVPNNPDATIRKAAQIKRAALAPANPSPQDRAVAAEASRMEAQAIAEKMEEAAGEKEGAGQPSAPKSANQIAAMAVSLKSDGLANRAVDA